MYFRQWPVRLYWVRDISQLNVELNSFLCYYSNVQSIRNKFNEFTDSADNYKPLIIGITETWLSEEVKDSEIEIANYDIFRCDRLEGKGDGSIMYIHNCLQSVACQELDNIGFQDSVWRIIQLKNNDKLLVGVVYRSPSSSNINNDKLFQVFHNAASKQGVTPVMIMGDFSMPEIKWNYMYAQANNESLSSIFFI